jgi:hypothetical protein
MKDRTWIVILLVAVIALLIVVVFQFVKHSKDVCNYGNPDKSYIIQTPNCIINFMCIQGRVAFRDECGCGCEVSS